MFHIAFQQYQIVERFYNLAVKVELTLLDVSEVKTFEHNGRNHEQSFSPQIVLLETSQQC